MLIKSRDSRVAMTGLESIAAAATGSSKYILGGPTYQGHSIQQIITSVMSIDPTSFFDQKYQPNFIVKNWWVYEG